jgi:mono/diheme cytochrome c family protein
MKAVGSTLAMLSWTALAGIAGNALAQDAMEQGKKLFTQTATPACAVCHTLAQAGATGEIGPSLDELKPDAGRVEKAIRDGLGQMPPFPNLTDAQVKALGQYVARASGAATK